MANIKQWANESLLKNKKNVIASCACLAGTVVLTVLTGIAFSRFSNYKVYFYGKDEGNTNVTNVYKFSDFSSGLKGTAGDADIYEIKGEQEGPAILVLGGTHPNEPSGQLTTTVLLENLKVNKGTVYLTTETNRSAYTHSHPQEASPFYYSIKTADGSERTFKFGSRATNTNEQWPNPDIYVHPSGQKLSTNETRNLNRAYPGLENGTYTEKVAYAITNFVKEKDVAILIDLHEASPEYLTINAVVAHQRSRIVADKYMDDMNDNMLVYHTDELGQDESEALTREIHSEESPTNLHGLTHREIGDYTDALSLLCETSNAAQGKYRGAFTEELITYGEENPDYAGDRFYEKSVMLEDYSVNSQTGQKTINFTTKNGILYARPVTISERVARHAESIYQIIRGYNALYTERALYDNTNVETAKTLKTAAEIDACLARRTAQGQFDIDWSNIYDTAEYDSLYASIFDQKIGNLLHSANK